LICLSPHLALVLCHPPTLGWPVVHCLRLSPIS
jgi:hypothetical protein